MEWQKSLIELHIHLDGSMSINTMRILAEMQGIDIPVKVKDIKKMTSVRENCKDLNEYLEKFNFPLSLLQTESALKIASKRLCNELLNDGTLYAEIRFAPQLHTTKGMTQEQAVKAVISGMKESRLMSNLILCCMRGAQNEEENKETIRLARKYIGEGVCALDLAGAEAVYKTKNFDKILSLGARGYIPLTVHCGEADGAKSIQDALKWKPKRLGHGIRILEDENLVKIAKKEGIFFELCPTSNLNTKVYTSYKEYPVKQMLQKGLRVTINTDNTTVSNTTLFKEYYTIIKENHLTQAEVCTLLLNAIDASFATKEQRKMLCKNIIKHIPKSILNEVYRNEPKC